MRSFLIRDILSGPAASSGESGAGEPTSSSFDCTTAAAAVAAAATAQNLAATQARFLAKLAEHQQQIQASKYYEQLQQQHQHLLNLNLGHHHLQQIQQQQQHHHQLIKKEQQQLSITKQSANIAANVTTTGATSSKREKISSFAYDCSSPISSISEVDQRDEEEIDEEEEDEEEEDDGGGERDDRQRAGLADGEDERQDDDDDDDEDDDDEEIEVEKMTNDQLVLGNNRRSTGRRLYRANGGSKPAYSLNARANGDDDNRDQAESSSCMSSQQQRQLIGKQSHQQPPYQLNSPLDALFQMTSTTFDALKRGEKRKERDAEHPGSANFTSKQASKKKRKSRTAFTNNQIYELERRFRVQKYLSPTDRDEIALTLNLSNAQVITWFQNRRAKLKRDVEEQKRDIETATLLNLHKTFLESYQALSQMKSAIKTTDNPIGQQETQIYTNEP